MADKTNVSHFFKHTVPCRTVFSHACFAVMPLQLSWTDARNHCVLLGGRLAEVTNSYINENLKQFADSKYIYLLIKFYLVSVYNFKLYIFCKAVTFFERAICLAKPIIYQFINLFFLKL